jgi:hypothetical protein
LRNSGVMHLALTTPTANCQSSTAPRLAAPPLTLRFRPVRPAPPARGKTPGNQPNHAFRPVRPALSPAPATVPTDARAASQADPSPQPGNAATIADTLCPLCFKFRPSGAMHLAKHAPGRLGVNPIPDGRGSAGRQLAAADPRTSGTSRLTPQTAVAGRCWRVG